jgi:predicted amidophosphoribosyltransferase
MNLNYDHHIERADRELEMSKFCANCGASSTETARFCNKCGAKLNPAQQVEEPEAPSGYHAAPPYQQPAATYSAPPVRMVQAPAVCNPILQALSAMF